MVGEPYDDTEFSGRSDYEAFILAGIPSGGLFTGAEEVEDRGAGRRSGVGPSMQQFDPCYHLACDTFANNNDHALEVNSDLIAFVQMTYAYSTETVNGVKGKKVPGPPAQPAGARRPGGNLHRSARSVRAPAGRTR